MRVLVSGGRSYDDRALVYRVLDALDAKVGVTLLIDGEAPGADFFGHSWALSRKVPTLRFRAQWSKYGNRAGPIRNLQMLDEGRPHILVAFPGGRGTAHMVAATQQANLRGAQIRILMVPTSPYHIRSGN